MQAPHKNKAFCPDLCGRLCFGPIIRTPIAQTGSQTVPILVSRLRETGGTKAKKSERSIEVSKMLEHMCLGYATDIFGFSDMVTATPSLQ